MIRTKSLLYTALISISLFQGCSGHALQDLIDGDSSQERSSQQIDNEDENSKTVAPSQNKALNSISPSRAASDKHEEYRQIQKSTNAWIEDEWEPSTENNVSDNIEVKSDENSTLSQENNSSTGLQYYVDKAEVYLEKKKKRDANKTEVPSHTEKIDAMPGIGKSDRKR